MNTPQKRIDSYKFGSITIEGKPYNKDLIICPDRIIVDWWRKQGHSLVLGDLGSIMDLKPEVIIIGCGAYGALKVPRQTRDWLAEKGIRLIDLPTRQACDQYNALCGSTRVVAGLHLTC